MSSSSSSCSASSSASDSSASASASSSSAEVEMPSGDCSRCGRISEILTPKTLLCVGCRLESEGFHIVRVPGSLPVDNAEEKKEEKPLGFADDLRARKTKAHPAVVKEIAEYIRRSAQAGADEGRNPVQIFMNGFSKNALGRDLLEEACKLLNDECPSNPVRFVVDIDLGTSQMRDLEYVIVFY